jgi:chromosome partitioning protein
MLLNMLKCICKQLEIGERMGKIIAFVNQKGGVGKTTSSINLAASLGLLGKKTLLVDLDPQGNATTGVGIVKSEVKDSVYELLTEKAEVTDVIIKTKFKNLYTVPASINLAGVDMELMEMSRNNKDFIAQLQLKKALETVAEIFDYIILDCPPSLGLITTNALAASNSVIIPVQCEFFALEGIMQLLNSIMFAQKKLNSDLVIEGVLLTMLDNRTNLGLEVVEEIKSYFKEKVYDTIIPRLVRLSEAPSHGKPIHAYDPKSRGTEAYLNLAKEVIERNGN